MPQPFTGYAVFDIETTGLNPNFNHRIVEIGIVRLDEDLNVIEKWETLINPGRDLGATHIHGIEASDLSDAPRFSDIAVDIWHRFEGAIPVSHNLDFDKRFLLAEYNRFGVEISHFDGLCTLRQARKFLNLNRNRLSDVCEHLQIPIGDLHSAGSDAWLCAQALKIMAASPGCPEKRVPVSCNELWGREASPHGITRKKARELQAESPLNRLIGGLPIASKMSAASQDAVVRYLELLDHVLEDRIIDDGEVGELLDLALEYGLTKDDVNQIHNQYVESLAALLLSDNRVTESERRDLDRVTNFLGVTPSTVDKALSQRSELSSLPAEDLSGNTVCFTGTLHCSYKGEQLTKTTAEELAQSKGLTVVNSVTKKLDILVTADPNSMSSKAKKARSYNVRILAERAFWQKLQVEVS